jgi:glycosyltransferase involved in cell wall biosynthesis
LCVLAGTADGAERITDAFAEPARPFRALAIMPAYNEADVIHHAIGALVAEGVDVYLLDHESTDGTAEAAAPWLGHGLLHIERFPGDAGYPVRNREAMVWREILQRVEEVSREVTADWYIFTNADEFREAPWRGMTLREGLQEVDELGFSAVDFALFDFRPVDDRFVPGGDPRRYLRFYEAGGRYDSMQVKAWKRQSGPVDIVSHGGHNVLFAGKRLFPIPFILRHYPIRGSAHGARKVLAERLPRFSAQERADGWHVQYDSYAAGREFLHDPATLLEWNGDAARAELLARATRSLLLAMCVAGADPAATDVASEPLGLWLARRGSATPHAALPGAQERLTAAAQGTVLVPHAELDAVARDLALALEAHARTRGELVHAQALGAARAALPSA